ncbi:hypothetical protein AX16_007677 [Volvariella volvacea WC 439]|nr:hypothetical protein AX16_007677 [Volvariella volvacea WC 439]
MVLPTPNALRDHHPTVALAYDIIYQLERKIVCEASSMPPTRYLLLYALTQYAVSFVAEEITRCTDYEEVMQLGDKYKRNFIHAFWLHRTSKRTSSFRFTRHGRLVSFDTVQDMMHDQPRFGKHPKNYVQAKGSALIRDDFRCQLTRTIDWSSFHASQELRECVDSKSVSKTEYCYIFPGSLPPSLDDKDEDLREFWVTLSHFGYPEIQEELAGENVNSLKNILTLLYVLYRLLRELKLWFEPTTPIPEGFREAFQIPSTVEFQTEHDLDLSSAKYLAIHAACCKIAWLSGEITFPDEPKENDYTDEIGEEQDETSSDTDSDYSGEERSDCDDMESDDDVDEIEDDMDMIGFPLCRTTPQAATHVSSSDAHLALLSTIVMTAITRNVPPVIRNLGVSIIGEKCYVSLVENLNVKDVICLQHAASKGVGLGIVAGGSIVKVPQIVAIIKAQTAEGLSLPGYVLETLSYSISLAYSITNAHPFSTYGENFFLTVQNVIITFLIVLYPPKSKANATSTSASYLYLSVLLALLSALPFIPPSLLSTAQLLSLPLSLSSKLTQIQQSYNLKSTGQLSAFAIVSQTVGCLVRLYTSLAEVGDWNVAIGYLGALALNLVIAAQMWAYWGQFPRRAGPSSRPSEGNKTSSATESVKVKVEEEDNVTPALAAPVPVRVEQQQSELGHGRPSTPGRVPAYGTGNMSPRRVSTPPPPQAQTPSSRKWTRKLD